MQITRQRIVDFLQQQKQATVEELTKAIGLTPMAVRHHLNVLLERGAIKVVTTQHTHKPGRPVQIYALATPPNVSSSQHYLQLSHLLLSAIQQKSGTEGISLIFSQAAEQMLQEAPVLSDDQSFEMRLDTVVHYLKEQGFVAEWATNQDGHYVIHYRDCPYRQLISQHPEVCLLDQSLVASMLQVVPQRTCCMANCDDYCTYDLGVCISDAGGT